MHILALHKGNLLEGEWVIQVMDDIFRFKKCHKT